MEAEKVLLLKARYRYNTAMDITPEDIKSAGVKAILIDADNTLSFHNSKEPYPGVTEWIGKIQRSGIPIVIISNNKKERIAPFAERLGLSYVENGAKPLPNGLLRACRRLGIKPSEAAVIGDQVFTDVLGGNLIKAKVFLTEPLGEDTNKFIKFKRKLEKFVR